MQRSNTEPDSDEEPLNTEPDSDEEPLILRCGPKTTEAHNKRMRLAADLKKEVEDLCTGNMVWGKRPRAQTPRFDAVFCAGNRVQAVPTKETRFHKKCWDNRFDEQLRSQDEHKASKHIVSDAVAASRIAFQAGAADRRGRGMASALFKPACQDPKKTQADKVGQAVKVVKPVISVGDRSGLTSTASTIYRLNAPSL
jgi:hypothetical protein